MKVLNFKLDRLEFESLCIKLMSFFFNYRRVDRNEDQFNVMLGKIIGKLRP